MPSAAYYREEAKRARAAAMAATDPDKATRWLRIAKDYETLAASLAEDEAKYVPPSPFVQGLTQQQPVQQQQGKLEPEGDSQ